MVALDIDVRRSSRRRHTVSARRDGDRIIVHVPDSLSPDQERHWVETMVRRIRRRELARADHDVLALRATTLAERYLGGHPRPTSVRWVGNMSARWGSCTPATGSIRISDRLARVPDYVLDYVLLHELAHLLVAGHGPQFWTLLQGYPRVERARGYLDGLAARPD